MGYADDNGISLYDIFASPALAPAVIPFLDEPKA